MPSVSVNVTNGFKLHRIVGKRSKGHNQDLNQTVAFPASMQPGPGKPVGDLAELVKRCDSGIGVSELDAEAQALRALLGVGFFAAAPALQQPQGLPQKDAEVEGLSVGDADDLQDPRGQWQY
eukprot:scaffold501620_cov48-Prasinocladus_malaysianus.AAC.1